MFLFKNFQYPTTILLLLLFRRVSIPAAERIHKMVQFRHNSHKFTSRDKRHSTDDLGDWLGLMDEEYACMIDWPPNINAIIRISQRLLLRCAFTEVVWCCWMVLRKLSDEMVSNVLGRPLEAFTAPAVKRCWHSIAKIPSFPAFEADVTMWLKKRSYSDEPGMKDDSSITFNGRLNPGSKQHSGSCTMRLTISRPWLIVGWSCGIDGIDIEMNACMLLTARTQLNQVFALSLLSPRLSCCPRAG